MSFLPAWKYQLDGMKWPLIIFYIVIAALLILVGVSTALATQQHTQFSVGGLEMASVVFIFIVGLNSFKSTFHMLSTNGVSRKTMFVSFLATLGAVAIAMALIDTAYSMLMKSVSNYEPAFTQMFNLVADNPPAPIIGLMWMVCSYLAAGMIGYLITTLFYRMNKAIKLLVAIGVPILVLFIWPVVDWTLFRGAVSTALEEVVNWASGASTGNPYIGMLSNIVMTAVFCALSFITLRRAPVKGRQQ